MLAAFSQSEQSSGWIKSLSALVWTHLPSAKRTPSVHLDQPQKNSGTHFINSFTIISSHTDAKSVAFQAKHPSTRIPVTLLKSELVSSDVFFRLTQTFTVTNNFTDTVWLVWFHNVSLNIQKYGITLSSFLSFSRTNIIPKILQWMETGGSRLFHVHAGCFTCS